MDLDKGLEASSSITVRPKKSLRTHLVLWIGLLALVPMTLVSWLSYHQAKDSLTEAAQKNLQRSSLVTVRSISNWFDYRLSDLRIHSEAKNTSDLMLSLLKGFNASGNSAEQFVQSGVWTRLVANKKNDLVTLSERYDYIYDLFLIDLHGNILYSVAAESDLGTNVLSASNQRSGFAKSVKRTLDSGKLSFSGLERYAPSNGAFAGFLSAPIIDESGAQIGAFAVQIRFDRVFDLLNVADLKGDSTAHYIISDSGMLIRRLRMIHLKYCSVNLI